VVRLVLVEGFPVEQDVGEGVELGSVLGEGGHGLRVALVDDAADLAVEELRRGAPATVTRSGSRTGIRRDKPWRGCEGWPRTRSSGAAAEPGAGPASIASDDGRRFTIERSRRWRDARFAAGTDEAGATEEERTAAGTAPAPSG
jgi:hypothetical protein